MMDADRELLTELATVVNEVLEYDDAHRVAWLMEVEKRALAHLQLGSLGWGSALAARGWRAMDTKAE
jgi:hypothetical protein